MSLIVLLVEDDRELRTTLRESLMVEGYQVVAAASLADAHALRPVDDAVALDQLDLRRVAEVLIARDQRVVPIKKHGRAFHGR